jgi:hypothetical protein
MKEIPGVQLSAPNIRIQEPINELQGAPTQQVEDSTQQMENAPEETPVSSVPASHKLEGRDESNTEKMDDISRSPLVEEKDTSYGSNVQLETKAEGNDQNSTVARELSSCVEQPEAMPREARRAESIPAQTPADDQMREKLSDIVDKLEEIKKTLKEMSVTLGQVIPGYINELLQEEFTDEAKNIEKDSEDSLSTITDEEITSKIKALKETFDKIVTNFGKPGVSKLQKVPKKEESNIVEFKKENSQPDSKEADKASTSSPSAVEVPQ